MQESTIHAHHPSTQTDDILHIEHQLALDLSASTDLNDSLNLVIDAVCHLEGIDCGGVYLVNRHTNDLVLVAHRGISATFIASASRISAHSPQMNFVRAGKPLYFNYASLNFTPEERRHEHLRGMGALPILYDEQLIAVMNVASHTCDMLPEHTRHTIEAIAAQVGGAIVRITTEHALRESTDNFVALFNTLDDFLFIVARDGHLIHVNPAVEHRLGYTLAEICTMHVLDVHPPDRHDEAAAIFAAMVHGDTLACYVPLSTKHGTRIPVETRVVMGTWNGSDVFFAISRDISERIRAEASLRESEQRFKLALESADLGLWDWNIATGDVVFNERWARMLGYDLADIQPHVSSWEQLIHPDDKENVLKTLQAHLDGTTPAYITEHRLQTRSGEWIWVQDYGKVVEHDSTGAPVRAIGTHRDITQQKTHEAELLQARQAAESAVRARSDFLANMSHELRTPLNVILGLSESLQEAIYGPLNTRQLRSLLSIEQAGRHLLSLINDILDLSKIEAGKIELQIEPVSIEEMCHASLHFIKQQASVKHIRVSLNIDTDLVSLRQHDEQVYTASDFPEVIMHADERRLKQILINLLMNAVKFTPEGGQVGLDVQADTHNNIVHFTVWDTGIGIAAADQQRLFQPFIQLDSSLSRQYEGTGLGLALVMQLTELHCGSVSLESEVGGGSWFCVSLPRYQTTRRSLSPVCNKPDIEPPNERRDGLSPAPLIHLVPRPPHQILLAEDNEANIIALVEYLETKGYHMVVARNGQEAIDRVREEPPDLILMDIQMPKMDGMEAIRQIRTIEHGASIPIIALTALAMKGDRERCLEAGANEYVSKPVRMKELAKMIAAMVGKE